MSCFSSLSFLNIIREIAIKYKSNLWTGLLTIQVRFISKKTPDGNVAYEILTVLKKLKIEEMENKLSYNPDTLH